MPQISGTMHLKIMKGIAKVPQDSSSAEVGLDEINLLDPNGFSCNEYLIKIPTMKSSAVYADSPLTDGRTLISGALGNVTETIRINLNSTTIVQMAAMLSKLGRFKQDCNDFWDTLGQIEPVYIKHQIVGEPGPRYALLYDIDIDVETPTNPNDTSRTVTLSIEREPGWRGMVAPGSNPLIWSSYIRNYQFNATNAILSIPGVSAARNLAFQTTLYNHIQISSNVDAKKNYIDIPAESVPGDLPALVNVQVYTANSASDVFISRDTNVKTTPSGVANPQRYDCSATEGSLGTDTSFTNDTGGIIHDAGSARRADISFASGTADAIRITWASMRWPNNKGRFLTLARMRQSGGASGDIRCHLQVFGINTGVTYETTEVIPTIQAGAGNTTDWPITTMGIIELPFSRLYNSANGNGFDATSAFTVRLLARRSTGVGVLYVCDVMLIPIGESAVLLSMFGNSNPLAVFLDTTGYFNRAKGGVGENIAYTEGSVAGQPFYLPPNVSSRLYFYVKTLTNTSQVGYQIDVGVNIVPRWSSLRSV